MSGYARAQFLVGLCIPCAFVAAAAYRYFVPGSWDFQFGQIIGTLNAYIALRLMRPYLSSPLVSGRE